ncbi:MAG: hypothetical protein KC535_01575 [Nanoarchaeota archaeon]|nr:hypothetical protein [Nanoarchaeota archaeon]
MKVPFSFLFQPFPDQMRLYTKKDKRNFFLKQAAYLPFSILSGAPLFSLFPHLAAAIGSLEKQPSKSRLEDILNYYETSAKPSKKFNWTAAGIAVACTAAFGLSSPETIHHVQEILSTDIRDAVSEYSKLVLFSGTLYETVTSVYSLMRRAIPLSKVMDQSSLKEEFLLHFTSKEPKTRQGLFRLSSYYLRTQPERGLAKFIEMYFDNQQQAEPFSHKVPEDFLLHAKGKNALEAFVSSLLSYSLPQYQQSFFKKAVAVALENKDISTLSLLALYDYKETGSTDLLRQQVNLLFEDQNINKNILAKGTFTDTYTLGYGGKEEPLAMTLVQKVSTDFKRLRDKKLLTNYLGESFPHNVTRVIDLSFRSDLHVLTELRMRYPLLAEVLSERPELLIEAYDLLGRFQDVLEHEKFTSLERMNIDEKYLFTPLLNTKEYEYSLEKTKYLYEDFGEYKPLLDFHANNLLVSADHLIDIDIENKGRGPKMIDLVNLTDFSFSAMNYDSLQRMKQKLLDKYQEEINQDTPFLDELYLQTAGLRRNSFLQARRTEQGYVSPLEVKQFLSYYAQVFSSYAATSSQKKLARNQLEITEQLYNTV